LFFKLTFFCKIPNLKAFLRKYGEEKLTLVSRTKIVLVSEKKIGGFVILSTDVTSIFENHWKLNHDCAAKEKEGRGVEFS